MNALIIICAKYLILIPVLVFVWQFFILDRAQKKRMLWLSGCILPLAYVVAKIGSHIFIDPRPFVTSGIAPLIPHAADNGFPSDHMLLASSLASVIYIFNKKRGLLLFACALIVGFARVFAGVHHIKDILGSFLISIIVSVVVYFLFTKWDQKNHA